jgi:hypothetical protein
MMQPQQAPRFPSYHLDSLLRSHHLSTITAKPLLRTTSAIELSPKRLRAAVATRKLPKLFSVNPCSTKSPTDTARAATNIETWLAYLPRRCVRRMILDGWHWNT